MYSLQNYLLPWNKTFSRIMPKKSDITAQYQTTMRTTPTPPSFGITQELHFVNIKRFPGTDGVMSKRCEGKPSTQFLRWGWVHSEKQINLCKWGWNPFSSQSSSLNTMPAATLTGYVSIPIICMLKPNHLIIAYKMSWVRSPPPIWCTHCSHSLRWHKLWVTTEMYLSSLSCVFICLNETIDRWSGLPTADCNQTEIGRKEAARW